MAPEKECLLLALSETLRGDGCWILITLSAQWVTCSLSDVF